MIRAVLLLIVLTVTAAQAQPVTTKAKFPEHTSMRWPIDFRDATGALVVPITAAYWITTYANAPLVPQTAITPLASHIELITPGLEIPPAELNQANPNLPDMIPVGLVVRATDLSGLNIERTFWFSLENNPAP